MTKKQKNEFVKKLAEAVVKYAPEYGITCNSIPIAQGCLESGFGGSRLCKQYNNIHGLKCGTLWKGPSVNMQTQDEFSPGTKTTITDNFRVYESFEEGAKGYFDFLGLARYKIIKGVSDPRKYAETIKADGYATDSSYVDSLMALVKEYGLEKYDKPAATEGKDVKTTKTATKADTKTDTKSDTKANAKTGTRTAKAYLDIFRSWIGYSEANGKYREILDLYNSHKPLARGYAIQPEDEWCDCTVSAAAIKADMVDLIGTEVGVENHVEIFKQKGIWIEDGNVAPLPGDIIVFNWDGKAQPNDGYSDHIGVVETVAGTIIHTIEGNSGEVVTRRTYRVGEGCIRGYARPKYDMESGEAVAESSGVSEDTQVDTQVDTQKNPQKDTAKDTQVNNQKYTWKETDEGPSKTPKYVAAATAYVNVRSWAGLEYPNIKSWPTLREGNLVDVCDTVRDRYGNPWMYVRIDGRIYGFVKGEFLKKV